MSAAAYRPELKFKPPAAFPMLPITRLDTENAIVVCHKQIAALVDYVRDLESYRDHHVAPIQKLPEDVLVEIFFHLVNAHDHRGTRRHHVRGRDYPHCWLYATHVCRAWREITLGCPLLWTRIISGRPERVEAFLTRSGKCSITLESTGGDPSRQFDSALYKLMLAERHRLLSLDGLRIDNKCLQEDLSKLSNVIGPNGLQIPLLESL
jgi:hypothetical protein